jgi:tetratricopeptide (TPR) repeat protein
MKLLLVLMLVSLNFSNDYEPAALVKKARSVQSKDPFEALKILKSAYFAAYPTRDTLQSLQNGFHKAIEQAMKAKNFEKALNTVEDALLYFPDVYEFLRYRMYIAWETENYNLCVFHASEIASQTGHENDETNFFQGRCYHRMKAYRNAIERLSRVSGSFPGKRAVMVLLGDSYYHHRELAKAMDYLNKAQALEKTADVTALVQKIEGEQQLETSYLISPPTPHFVIKTSQELMAESREILEPMLESIFGEYARSFQFYPESPVTVIVYDNEKQDFSSRLQNPNWAGGVYDGEIRIPKKEIRGDEYHLETLIRHEMVHLFLDNLTRNMLPVWFNEGCAQYFEKPFRFDGEGAFSKRRDAPLPQGFKSMLSQAIKNNKLYSVEKLSDSFLGYSANEALTAYAQSLMAFRYFVDQYGMWKVRRLLRSLYVGKLFEVAFEEEAGMSSEEFFKAWEINQKKQWKLQ